MRVMPSMAMTLAQPPIPPAHESGKSENASLCGASRVPFPRTVRSLAHFARLTHRAVGLCADRLHGHSTTAADIINALRSSSESTDGLHARDSFLQVCWSADLRVTGLRSAAS